MRDRCRTIAAGHKQLEFKDGTVTEYFAQEQLQLITVESQFDSYKETPARASTTSYDRNRHSVHASAVGTTVMIRAYADRIVVIQDGNVIGEHRRQFGRDKIIYDAWHYIEILKHKPIAFRNGAPFKEWALLWEEANRKHFVLKGAL